MDTRCNEGLIYFNLYRCTDVVGAYKVAKEIVVNHLNGVDEWSEEFLTSAKSSLIFEYIEGEKTPLALASTSLCSYFRNVPEGYTRFDFNNFFSNSISFSKIVCNFCIYFYFRGMIEKISAVQIEELRPIADKYFRPLFFENYVCSVVCPSDKVSAIAEGFSK